MKKYHFLIALLMLFATTSVSVEASVDVCTRDLCSCTALCAPEDEDCEKENSPDTFAWKIINIKDNEDICYGYDHQGDGILQCEPSSEVTVCGRICKVRENRFDYNMPLVEKKFIKCRPGGKQRMALRSSSEGAPGSEGAARRIVHMPRFLNILTNSRLRLSSNKNKNRNRNGNSLFSRAITQSQLPHTSGNNSMKNSDTGPGKVPELSRTSGNNSMTNSDTGPEQVPIGNGSKSEGMAGSNGSNGTRPPKCLLQVEQGICEAVIPKWYFDINAFKKGHKVGGYPLGTCKEFTWGGCTHYTGDGDGNVAGVGVNRFDTREECQSACENIME